MKKYVKVLCAVLLAVLMVASLAACGEGGGGNTDSVVGTWTLNQIQNDEGKSYSLEEFVRASASSATDDAVNEAVDQLKMTLTFTEDGKATFHTALQDAEGTFTFGGSTITMKTTIDGKKSKDNLSLKDNSIIMQDSKSGLTFVFKK